MLPLGVIGGLDPPHGDQKRNESAPDSDFCLARWGSDGPMSLVFLVNCVRTVLKHPPMGLYTPVQRHLCVNKQHVKILVFLCVCLYVVCVFMSFLYFRVLYCML